MEELEGLAACDPGEVFRRLQGAPVPDLAPAFAAEFLFLQRLSFSGKAVGTRRGRWASPGFNQTSAYGVAATARFGEVKPMIPSMVKVLKHYHRDLQDVDVDVRCEPAGAPRRNLHSKTLVYLDPPYAESTSYPDGQMSRPEVVALAQAWRDCGASVMVSEQHSLDLPGWARGLLSTGRDDTSPFRGKQQEWITYAEARQLAVAAK
jgi:site-specific DNA-adenine methylase